MADYGANICVTRLHLVEVEARSFESFVLLLLLLLLLTPPQPTQRRFVSSHLGPSGRHVGGQVSLDGSSVPAARSPERQLRRRRTTQQPADLLVDVAVRGGLTTASARHRQALQLEPGRQQTGTGRQVPAGTRMYRHHSLY